MNRHFGINQRIGLNEHGFHCVGSMKYSSIKLSVTLQEADLKAEIGKLESAESFHADFAHPRKPLPQSDEGVSVKDLCRKTR